MQHTNKLINETSPYLLQHAHNPVDWYSWGAEAFEKAEREDKPVFLSIGYSTCHWCHVMARESFEDEDVAAVLNKYFVSVKVDREERPDIDNIYMRVCQAFTGGGGWPTSIFMSSGQKPFFAGTYFPKEYFISLLLTIKDKWAEDRSSLLKSENDIAAALKSRQTIGMPAAEAPVAEAVSAFRRAFDSQYGGFGQAPKFPSPHNLMFLLYTAPELAEKTLLQMYKGGIFDHIGYGFCRYSTDRFWLAPHFEKMLYDNALLTLAYLLAYEVTEKALFKSVAEKTLRYIRRELESPGGGYFSAQDADSDGVEGKYYVFTPDELMKLLGEADGQRFCDYFDITETGNFEGRNIPNIISRRDFSDNMDDLLPKVYDYRRQRTSLRLDHKILTAWNALTIAALAAAFRILGDETCLFAAEKAVGFIESDLTDGDTLFAGITDGKRGSIGFLDDYAFYIFALLSMHQATQDGRFLDRAAVLTDKAIAEYSDPENGGFFFSGRHNEKLISNPKETYDGAIPSGNSVMAYNLSRLAVLTGSETYHALSRKQNAFMNAEASAYPSGYGFYLYSARPTTDIVCVLAAPEDLKKIKIRSDWVFRVTSDPKYPAINGLTTYYVCAENTCYPPSNCLPAD